MVKPETPDTRFSRGLAFALTSALTFALSGPFARALMDAGWSPTAAVIARLAGGTDESRRRLQRGAVRHIQHIAAMTAGNRRRQRGEPVFAPDRKSVV